MSKKIKTIIIASVFVVLAAVYTVFYIINPEATISFTKRALNFICNKPLPVIGFTILGLGILALEVISKTSIGKKALRECREALAESREELKKTREEKAAIEQEFSDFKQEVSEQIKNFELSNSDKMRKICYNIPNKRVKELGEQLYGTKEDSETTVD